MQQPNLLQQQLGNSFQQLLSQQSPEQRAAEFGGANVIQAAQPIFQRNLNQALQTQLEFGGPRFASENFRQAGQLQSTAMQDFNLFQQNVLESGLNRQLQARGQDINALLGAGQFSLGQGQLDAQMLAQRLGFLAPLLQTGLTAGGATASPVITQQDSRFGSTAKGALSGAATGATIGSVVPGLGTGIGAAVGGGIGLLGGLFG